MSVIERARQVQGLAGRRVRRARPSEPRAGTVTPLSVRTLTGGVVGIGRDVRPSYVQVGAGARMYGFTTRGGRALPSIRTLDNMDTPVSRRTDSATPRASGEEQKRVRKARNCGGVHARAVRQSDVRTSLGSTAAPSPELAAPTAVPTAVASPPIRGALWRHRHFTRPGSADSRSPKCAAGAPARGPRSAMPGRGQNAGVRVANRDVLPVSSISFTILRCPRTMSSS